MSVLEGGLIVTFKKIILLLISCLIVLSLAVASCGPATVEEEEEEMGLLPPEVPKYGGTLTMVYSEPFGFDPYYNFQMECKQLFLCNEELLMGDWTKGPAGTGETDWTSGCLGFAGLLTGQLCEEWEFKDDRTLWFKIRQGVHWWDKPPMNGRELTAKDVEYNFHRYFGLGSGYTEISPYPYYNQTFPG